MIFLDAIVIIIIILIIFLGPKYYKFRQSDYHFESKNDFFKTVFDKGNYGEFLTFVYLEQLAIHKRIMANLYIPKEDGSTTEIDLIMISETGIYVFESKNYSGWIFGNEGNKNWTQSLKNKQKFQFYNPILQNKGHISALDRIIGIPDIYKSYIVFSERCELKQVNITSTNIKVLKRNHLFTTIENDIKGSPEILSKQKVDQIYNKLKEFAYVDDSVKAEHIKGIRAIK